MIPIKEFKDKNNRDINGLANLYYQGINNFFNRDNMIKVANIINDIATVDELRDIMPNSSIRHKLIKIISDRAGYKSTSNKTGVTCYIYACICFMIFRILGKDPVIYVGSDSYGLTYTHSWVEVDGKIYDYDNNKDNINIPRLKYHKGSWEVIDQDV